MDDPASAPPPASARRAAARSLGARRGLLLAGAALLVTAALAWWLLGRRPKPDYLAEPVTRGEVAATVTASGTVNPVVTVQVGTYVSGVIQELLCDFNTRVHTGQLCARIDPRPYQTVVDQDSANLATARAQLRKDEAGLELSRLTWERNRDLLALDSVSTQSVDQAFATLQQARAQVEYDKAAIAQREAELETARVNLGYTNILSPVDGTVVSRNVTQGQTVAASFQTPTLFVIATDLTRMQVDTNVSESDIGDVALDELATFTVEAFPARIFRGHIVQVRQSPQTVQNVVTYDAVVEVPNQDLALKPGMTAAVRIITRQVSGALRVPLAALRYAPSAAGPAARDTQRSAPLTGARGRVWRLAGGRPEAVAVLIGLMDETQAEVRGDLHEGERVIVAERGSGSAGQSGTPGGTGPRAMRF